MHKIRILLLALFFLLGSSAYAMAPVHTCCPVKQCSVAQCLDMCCAPAPMQPAAMGRTVIESTTPTFRDYIAHVPAYQPDRYEEVWTPPD